jgi:hypothetical protein
MTPMNRSTTDEPSGIGTTWQSTSMRLPALSTRK